VEHRLAEHLRHLGQADSNLRKRGDPEPFLLIYAMQGSVGIKHPAWDPSWPMMTAEDVDDLAELEFVRIDPETNVERRFSLTVKGREQAGVLADPPRTYVDGRAPSIHETLDWLIAQEKQAPERFDLPTRLIDEAVSSGVISQTGRDALATRILDLRAQGYLEGLVPEVDQASAEQLLGLATDGLRLTMKAHDRAEPAATGGNTVNFHGSVVAGQIAAGDITNYVSFADVLDRAAKEITALDQIDQSEREEALSLIDVLRGKAANLSAEVLTGAGGALLGAVLAQLLGLPTPAG
jgi:hypothetical protein